MKTDLQDAIVKVSRGVDDGPVRAVSVDAGRELSGRGGQLQAGVGDVALPIEIHGLIR